MQGKRSLCTWALESSAKCLLRRCLLRKLSLPRLTITTSLAVLQNSPSPSTATGTALSWCSFCLRGSSPCACLQLKPGPLPGNADRVKAVMDSKKPPQKACMSAASENKLQHSLAGHHDAIWVLLDMQHAAMIRFCCSLEGVVAHTLPAT